MGGRKLIERTPTNANLLFFLCNLASKNKINQELKINPQPNNTNPGPVGPQLLLNRDTDFFRELEKNQMRTTQLVFGWVLLLQNGALKQSMHVLQWMCQHAATILL